MFLESLTGEACTGPSQLVKGPKSFFGAQEKRCNVLKTVQCFYCTVSKNTLFCNTCLYTYIPLVSWLNLLPAIWGDNLFYFRSCNKVISFQFKFPFKNEFNNSGCLSLPYVFFVSKQLHNRHLENQSFHQTASFLRGWNVDISNLNVTWCSFLQAHRFHWLVWFRRKMEDSPGMFEGLTPLNTFFPTTLWWFREILVLH